MDFTAEEQRRVTAALKAIAAGGYHKKDIRAEIKRLEEQADRITDRLWYGPAKRVWLTETAFTWRTGDQPLGFKDRRGGHTWDQERAIAAAVEAAGLRRNAELYRYVLAHGDFPKGYRR